MLARPANSSRALSRRASSCPQASCITTSSVHWWWSAQAAPPPICGTTTPSGSCPSSTLTPRSMWRSLRIAPLLTGHRGSPPVDTNSIEQLLQRLGRMAEDNPEITELDINPIIATPTGAVVVRHIASCGRVG